MADAAFWRVEQLHVEALQVSVRVKFLRKYFILRPCGLPFETMFMRGAVCDSVACGKPCYVALCFLSTLMWWAGYVTIYSMSSVETKKVKSKGGGESKEECSIFDAYCKFCIVPKISKKTVIRGASFETLNHSKKEGSSERPRVVRWFFQIPASTFVLFRGFFP